MYGQVEIGSLRQAAVFFCGGQVVAFHGSVKKSRNVFVIVLQISQEWRLRLAKKWYVLA